MKTENIISFVIDRAKERSTWAGIATLAGLVGLKVSPEVLGAASSIVISFSGLYEVLRRERRR